MKSPITGKEMQRQHKPFDITFRKETFNILYHFWWDADNKEEFTTPELDTLNLKQVYNQYREKYNLPFPDQIKEIREKYQLNQTKMAEVLGFGVNMYRQYENGEVPSISNARLIQLAEDPAEFKKLITAAENLIDGKTYEAVIDRVDTLIREKSEVDWWDQFLKPCVDKANVFNGFKQPSLEKLTEMIVFFASEIKPWKTQLNKLLFYSDFCHYRKEASSISGTEYVAINMGPVPNHFSSIFERAVTHKCIDVQYVPMGDYLGEKFVALANRRFNQELFSEEELQTLETVKKRLGEYSTKQIVELSHEEAAWKENIENKRKISYNYAFDLEHI